MDISITFKEFLAEQHIIESTDLSGYVNLLNDVAMFITLNTAMIQQYAIDDEAKMHLRTMQKELKGPMLNGQSFVEIHSKPLIYKMKNVIPIILRYIYNLIKYVEPRLKLYIQPNHLSKFVDRLENIKTQYREQVSYLTTP